MAIRWAICGAGLIGNDFCNCLRSLPTSEHEIVAVAAQSKDRAAEFAKKFNIPQSFGSYEEMTTLPNVDVVYVNNIHPLHVDCCLMFINAGMNVLCEKPMALSAEGCRKVLEAAKDKGVFFMEGWWTRFFPAFKYLREQVVEKRVIGDVSMIDVDVGGGPLSEHRLKKWRVGGSCLADIGIYIIQVTNAVFQGTPSQIKAVASFANIAEPRDSGGAIILQYGSNQLASLSFAADTPRLYSSMTVRGTKGVVKIPNHVWCPTTVYVGEDCKEFPLPEIEDVTFNYPNSQGFVYEIQAVRECLQQGKKECSVVPHADSQTINQIFMEVIRQMGVSYGDCQ